MPFIAIKDGSKKAPRQVGLDEKARCPSCDEILTVRRQSEDGRARHFWHSSRAGGGGGGNANNGAGCASVAESDAHMKWKSFAADRLDYLFGDRVSNCQMEYELDAPLSEKNHRIADAIVLFNNNHPILGKGVVIEVQHKNNSKNITATTQDYIEQDISVVWADADDFANDRCVLEMVDIKNRAKKAAIKHYFETISLTPYDSYPDYQDFSQFNTSFKCEATIPPEYYDEKARELWRSQNWGDLFTNGTERKILHGLIDDRTPTELLTAEVPQPAIDKTLYQQDVWKHYPTASDYIPDGINTNFRMEVTFPVEVLKETLERKRDERLSMPQTPFDDVQCHVCGNYRYAATAPMECENCGTNYDWDWNVSTGRISPENSPAHRR